MLSRLHRHHAHDTRRGHLYSTKNVFGYPCQALIIGTYQAKAERRWRGHEGGRNPRDLCGVVVKASRGAGSQKTRSEKEESRERKKGVRGGVSCSSFRVVTSGMQSLMSNAVLRVVGPKGTKWGVKCRKAGDVQAILRLLLLHGQLLVLVHDVLLGRRVLVLLVLRHQVLQVGLGLGELELVHTLAGVPVQESLSPEHGRELIGDSLEQDLDGGRVSDEGGRHLEASRRNVTVGGLNVVGDPFNKVLRVLGLHGVHGLVDFLHRDLSSPVSGDGEVSTLSGIGRGHHVLGVEELTDQFGNADGSVLLRLSGGQGRETGHEEVETREGDHVDGQFSQILQATGSEASLQAIARQLTEFKDPGNRREVVTPLMTTETKWFKSPKVGWLIFKVFMQMSYKASLSIQKVSSEFSTSW